MEGSDGSMAGATSNAPSAAATAAVLHRERDLPPAFDGGDPSAFKRYERDLALWQFETDLPEAKHGVKMLRQLTGPARAAADELSVEQITSSSGSRLILEKLKEHFSPYLESALPRAFEKAIYAEHRKPRESLQDYVIRMDGAFKDLKDEGIALNDVVKGYVIFRHASLTQVQEDQLTTWSAGSYEREKIIKGLRKLEKISRDQKNKSYVVAEDGDDVKEMEDSYGMFGDDDDQDYVWIGEGDLNDIYEESDLQEALATYQEVRRAIREQRNSRGAWHKGKGKDQRRGTGPFRQRGDAGARRVHVDMLKLRTKCARCGQIGHWAKECTGQPDAYAKSKAESSRGSTLGSSMSGKSGFFSAQVDEKAASFWLDRHGKFCEPVLGDFLKNKNHQQSAPFCGISTLPQHGVVDTAAQSGLIGKEALDRLQINLGGHGLKVVWKDKKAQARGVGGPAQVVGVADIPLGIGGVCGVLECTVVQEDVPLLLPIRLLRDLEVLIDLAQHELTVRKFGVKVPLHTMPSGHATIAITEFGEKGWKLPIEAQQAGLKEEEFLTSPLSGPAMFGASFQEGFNDRPNSKSSLLHDSAMQCASFGVGGREHGALCGLDQCATALASSGQSSAESRQGKECSRGRGRGIALRWLCCWIMAASSIPTAGAQHIQDSCSIHTLTDAFKQARGVCTADSARSVCGPQEVCQEAHPRSGGVQSPTEVIGGSGQRVWQGSMVPGVSCSLESLHNSADGQEEHNNSSSEGCSSQLQQCSISHEQPIPDTTRGHEASGSALCMSATSNQAHSQEGGTHKGDALLPMPQADVSDVCMGGGSEDRKATAEHGSHGATPGHGGDPSDEAGAEKQGGATEGSDCRAQSSEGDGKGCSCRGNHTAAGSNAGAEEATLSPDTAHAAASTLDDGSGRRGTYGKGIPGSNVPAGSCRTDSRTDQGDGEATEWSVRKPQDEERQDRDDAPWMSPILSQEQHNTALICQLRHEGSTEAGPVKPGFWRRGPEGAKEYEPGILPDTYGPGRFVGVLEEPPDEDYLDEAEGTLKRGCRKRLTRAMKQVRIGEVYSEPRVTKQAEAQGIQSAGAYDLKNGYDFTKASDRERCFRKLEAEDPDVLVISPPCGPFSILQEWNYRRMPLKKAVVMLQEGVQHLNFAMRLYEWQVRRGKVALFEHPKGARSWHEPRVERCRKLPGVQLVDADQCQFGLRVKEHEELNKKPTRFMVNSTAIAEQLSRQCPGEHKHQALTSGRAKAAEEYTPALCQAIIQGAQQHASSQVVLVEEDEGEDLEDALDRELEGDEETQAIGRMKPTTDEEVEDEDQGIKQLACAVTPQEKKLIHKLHQNLGHPARDDFCRALRMGRARDEVLEYVKKEYECQLCKQHSRPKPARPAAISQTYEPNKVVGIDVVFFPGISSKEQVPVLNITDWGSCYQTLERLEGMSSEQVWQAFQRSWCRVFSMPEVLVVDQGREFLGEFARKAGEHGALIRNIGARAPWQNGRTERHGGIAKEMFIKMMDQVTPRSPDEWQQCLHQVEAAKNRMFHRSGFSPAQRQLGQNTRIPGSLMADDKIDASMLRAGAAADVRRSLEIRDAAMQAFIKFHAQASISRAARAQTRKTTVFLPGEVVYVYRKPLPRKRDSRITTRPMWCGPGSVIMTEGRNAWISMRGELWKCALEQVRKATGEEEEALGLLKDEFEELKEDMKRRPSKRGFKDITSWEFPPMEEEDEEPSAVRRRLMEEEQQTEGTEEAKQGTVSEPYSPSAGNDGNFEEPPSANSTPQHRLKSPASEEPPEIPQPIPSPVMEQATRATLQNERLDGTIPSTQSAKMFEPVRGRIERMRWRPYEERSK